MPLTPHPKETTSVNPSSYDVQANTDQMGRQANQTLVLDAKPGFSLGVNGEKRAFGKPQVDKMGGMLGATTSILFENYADTTKNGKGKQGMLSDASIGGDRGMITRQVASYEADKFLGLNALSEERYGVDANGKTLGISIQADGAGVNSTKGRLDIDYSDPRIQRGLSDLETSDYIMGQVDRHPANIFIDPKTGKVTGIDNDMSLPEVPMEEVLGRDGGLVGKVISTMPKRMHEDTARKILATDPEEFRKVLSRKPPRGGPKPLSKAAINGAVERLKAMQKELQKGDQSSIQVVKAFDKNTYDAAIQEQVDAYNNLPGNLKDGVKFDDGVKPGDTTNINWNKGLKLRYTPITSYIGSIEIAKHTNNLTPEKDRLAAHQDGPEADKVQLDAITDPQKLLGAGYRRMSPEQQKAFDKEFKALNKLEAKLEAKEKHLTRLGSKPKAIDKIAAVSQGGISGMKQKDVNSINRLKQSIAGKMNVLTQSARDAITPPGVNITQPGNTVTQPGNTVNRGGVNQGNGLDTTTVRKNNAVIGELNTQFKKKLRDTNPNLTASVHKTGEQQVEKTVTKGKGVS